jgi:hypothetical protein
MNGGQSAPLLRFAQVSANINKAVKAARLARGVAHACCRCE